MKNSNQFLKSGFIFIVATICLSMNSKAIAQSNERQPPNFTQLLEEFDENQDKKLSKDEVKGRLAKDFDRIDSNEDGFISEDEFTNAGRKPRPQH